MIEATIAFIDREREGYEVKPIGTLFPIAPSRYEFATLAWAEWFSRRHLLEPPGCVPPAEYEERYHEETQAA
jgi:hypothetical protein